MEPSGQESYRDRFDNVLKEKELFAVQSRNGETSSWSTNGAMSFRAKLVTGAIFAVGFLTVFAFGLFKITAG
jgi:hypothetical protein